MRRNKIIYGTLLALAAILLAVPLADRFAGRAAPVAMQATAGRYLAVVPDARPEQIAQWEANAAEYERQQAAADACEAEAHADMDAAPVGDTETYNAAVDRANACDNRVDVSLVENHPLYEVSEGMVAYVG